VIVDGDPNVLVELAERIGKDLAQEALATSQIRAIFGKVRELDMRLRAGHVPSNAELDETTYRELQLLRPKLAYQAARAPGRGVTNLRKVLDPAIQLVERDRARFQHFVDFFEAILAYHRAHGGQ
jgi:CRISPR-associated protein Csm2